MKKATSFLLLILLSIFIPIIKADAASLHYNVFENNGILEAQISVDSDSLILKAIEGVINFDPNEFELLNVQKSNDSILEKWGIEPHLSEDGALFFNGIFNSEINGNNLFSLFFKKIGESNDLKLSIASGTTLTADNELNKVDSLLREEKISLFNISSSTHPDPNSFYSNQDVKLSWQLPKGTERVKLLIDNKPDSYPSVDYNEPIYEKEIKLDDGIWYFHIRCFLDGKWSSIEHRKIMIDTKNPQSFDANIVDGIIELNAVDDLSSIDFYEIEIPCLNEKYYTTENTFNLNPIKKGNYEVKLRAYDKASNYLEKEENIKVKEINSPHFSGIILGRDELFISGYVDDPNSKVYASILGQESNIEKISNVSNDGKFVYAIDKLDPGLYSLYLMTIGDDGVSVKNKKAILIIDKKMAVNIAAQFLVLSGLAILAVLAFYILLTKWKNNGNKKKKKSRKNSKKNNKNKLYDI
ncbi:MAG: hypothetical protein PHY30_00270 [Candidatus Pacebacteria bacterium]|nr:hypothetical protein [Candidatus Paceibacterota bacterium]